jgi:hypothetical protein
VGAAGRGGRRELPALFAPCGDLGDQPGDRDQQGSGGDGVRGR